MRIYCEVYAHLYVDRHKYCSSYGVREACHLQAREQNGEHFVYSKLIVKRPYSRLLYIAFLKYALKYT